MEKVDSTSELFPRLITKMSCSLISERQEINIRLGSLAHQIYGKESVIEKYNCSYSLNEMFRNKFEDSDLHCVGTNNDGDVRIVEIPNCRFFVATLFQPQLNPSESFPHPLIVSFLKTASEWIVKKEDIQD